MYALTDSSFASALQTYPYIDLMMIFAVIMFSGIIAAKIYSVKKLKNDN